jgi:hypothetical protein
MEKRFRIAETELDKYHHHTRANGTEKGNIGGSLCYMFENILN